VFLVLGVIAACEVTNPGPVQDEFLNQPAAHEALVNGAGRRLSIALSTIGYTSSHAARETLPGGQTGSGGHSPVGQAGRLLSSEVSGHWSNAQQARWIAEDAIRRFTAAGAAKADPLFVSRAHLFAGFAYRTLGENMCDAVINGGAKQPNSKYFEGAIAAFGKAIETAPTSTAGSAIRQAAYVGRAAAKMWMKDWPGAVADARQVPAGFAFRIPVSLDDVKQNGADLYWANQNSPYRGYSMHGTWHMTHYDQTGDARAAYGASAQYPLAQQQLSGFGAVPWRFSLKYQSGFEHRIASYNEALLIQAEAALVSNNIASAMTLINQVHTQAKNNKTGGTMAPLGTPATLNEAWTLLKRERNLEFYLEARRMGDLRRWAENQTPGDIDWPNFEAISVLFRNNPPSRCFPIPDSELDTNPNLG
jgi:hypothetical protein